MQNLTTREQKLVDLINFITMDGQGYRTQNGVPQEIPKKVNRLLKCELRELNALKSDKKETI